MADKKTRKAYFEEIKAIVAADEELVAFVQGELLMQSVAM